MYNMNVYLYIPAGRTCALYSNALLLAHMYVYFYACVCVFVFVYRYIYICMYNICVYIYISADNTVAVLLSSSYVHMCMNVCGCVGVWVCGCVV